MDMDASTTQRGAREGFAFGILAGVILAIMLVIDAVRAGSPPIMPIRLVASVVLGKSALETDPRGTVLLVGVLTHLALSGIFGLIYGLANARMTPRTQTNWGRQLALGLGFGVLLWFVNIQVIARNFFPWFLNAPQFLQMMMHALFFGLPLGLMYARAERRVRGMLGPIAHRA